MFQAITVVRSIASEKRLVLYGLLLVGLHAAGILLLYRLVSEFDMIPHFWFGYVLSEYSSTGANSMKLQQRLTQKLRKAGWLTADLRTTDIIIRFGGFLLIGGLIWESLELFFNPLVGVPADSFFAFPITLSTIDGFLDVTIGLVGATLAFLVSSRIKNVKGD